jgi:hypothetical protein
MRRTMRSRFAVLTALVVMSACGEEASNESSSLSTPSIAARPTPVSASVRPTPSTSVLPSSASPATPPPSPPTTATTGTTQLRSFEPVINTVHASVFGQSYAATLDIDAFASDVSGALGDATWDTGWQAMPPEHACTGHQSYRTIWWGDLRMTFETGPQPATLLTAWSMGDPSVSSLAPLGPLPPSSEPTGMITSEGIGIGTSLDELKAALGDRPYIVIDNRVDVVGALVTTFLLDDDQRVAAIGSGRVDCIDESQV